ncbi:MAG: alpha/beta fold hydrolase [Azoarcus sp.]|nr:alpha/beta fold hydrolase [Azoarcus sp.]
MEYQFASLMPEDEPAVTLHLLSLDEEDRALRFGSCTSDLTLLDYVHNLNFNRDVAEGAWDGGRLVGFAHLAVYPEAGYPVGELGLSISRGYRGRGIAARLIRHAVLRARRFRLTTMYIHYMRRNLAMTRLVRHLGLKVAYEGDEARASLEVTPRERSIHCEAHRGGHNGRLEVFKSLPPRAARGHVLLVHGAGGDGWQWRAVLADLAEAGYAAHALSLSGHGCSEPAAPSFAQLSDDVDSVLADLPDDTCLVGHSLGGYLVQRTLEASPRPAAVLLAPVPPDVPRDQELASLLAGLSGKRTRAVAASVLDDAESIRVEQISTPVTLISGERDRVMPVPWMRATAERYDAPWTRLQAGHNLPVAPGVSEPILSGLRYS